MTRRDSYSRPSYSRAPLVPGRIVDDANAALDAAGFGPLPDGLTDALAAAGHVVYANWAALPGSPSNGALAYLTDPGVALTYLDDLGDGATGGWVPTVSVSGGAVPDLDVYLDAGLITGVADGGTVATVPNGAGADYTQGTDASRALYRATGGPSSGPAIEFDGSNDYYQTTDLAIQRNRACILMFAVMSPDDVAADDSLFYGSVNGGTGARALFGFDGTGKHRAGGRRLDADGTDYVDGGTPIASAWTITAALLDYGATSGAIFHKVDPTGLDLWGIAHSDGSMLTASTANTSDTDAATVTLGGNAPLTKMYDGKVSQFVHLSKSGGQFTPEEIYAWYLLLKARTGL